MMGGPGSNLSYRYRDRLYNTAQAKRDEIAAAEKAVINEAVHKAHQMLDRKAAEGKFECKFYPHSFGTEITGSGEIARLGVVMERLRDEGLTAEKIVDAYTQCDGYVVSWGKK